MAAAPDTPRPVSSPPDSATAPAATSAETVCCEVANTVTDAASTLDRAM